MRREAKKNLKAGVPDDTCPGCREVDFTQIFDRRGPSYDTIRWTGLSLDHVDPSSACSVCNFLHACHSGYDTIERFKSQYLRLIPDFRDADEPPDHDEPAALCVASEPFGSSRAAGEYRCGRILEVDRLARLYSGRIIPPCLDFSLVQHWVQSCTTHHDSECQVEKKTAIRDLRMIDCSTLEIILWSDNTADDNYVALSYV